MYGERKREKERKKNVNVPKAVKTLIATPCTYLKNNLTLTLTFMTRCRQILSGMICIQLTPYNP